MKRKRKKESQELHLLAVIAVKTKNAYGSSRRMHLTGHEICVRYLTRYMYSVDASSKGHMGRTSAHFWHFGVLYGTFPMSTVYVRYMYRYILLVHIYFLDTRPTQLRVFELLAAAQAPSRFPSRFLPCRRGSFFFFFFGSFFLSFFFFRG